MLTTTHPNSIAHSGNVSRLLALAGSLRGASCNTALLEDLSREPFPGVRLTVKSLAAVSLSNEDHDVARELEALGIEILNRSAFVSRQ